MKKNMRILREMAGTMIGASFLLFSTSSPSLAQTDEQAAAFDAEVLGIAMDGGGIKSTVKSTSARDGEDAGLATALESVLLGGNEAKQTALPPSENKEGEQKEELPSLSTKAAASSMGQDIEGDQKEAGHHQPMSSAIIPPALCKEKDASKDKSLALSRAVGEEIKDSGLPDSKKHNAGLSIDIEKTSESSAPQNEAAPASEGTEPSVSHSIKSYPSAVLTAFGNGGDTELEKQEGLSSRKNGREPEEKQEVLLQGERQLAEPAMGNHVTPSISTELPGKLEKTAEAQPEEEKDRVSGEKLIGTWRGYFTNAYGRTGATLSVKDRAGELYCVFTFYPTKENPNTGSGQFEMTASFNKSKGELELRGSRWIKNPKRRALMHLRGNVKGNTFSGRIFANIPTPAGWTFELQRKGK